MKRSCPHHGIQEWSLLRIFYSGLSNQDRLLLDAAAGGALCDRAIDEGFKLIDNMALNQTQYHRPREDPAYFNAKMNRVEGNDRLLAEIAALHKKFDGLNVNAVNSNPPPYSSSSLILVVNYVGAMITCLLIVEWP